MNGYQALEIMKNGGFVSMKGVGGKFFIESGFILFKDNKGKTHHSTFNFDEEYEEIEETYTGLQAIELMRDGYHAIELTSYPSIYFIKDSKLLCKSYTGIIVESQSFNANAQYKLYKGDL